MLVIDPARLKRARMELAMTQEELGSAAELQPATISRIEGGLQSPRLSSIRKLALALGVSPLDIATVDESLPPIGVPTQRQAVEA